MGALQIVAVVTSLVEFAPETCPPYTELLFKSPMNNPKSCGSANRLTPWYCAAAKTLRDSNAIVRANVATKRGACRFMSLLAVRVAELLACYGT